MRPRTISIVRSFRSCGTGAARTPRPDTGASDSSVTTYGVLRARDKAREPARATSAVRVFVLGTRDKDGKRRCNRSRSIFVHTHSGSISQCLLPLMVLPPGGAHHHLRGSGENSPLDRDQTVTLNPTLQEAGGRARLPRSRPGRTRAATAAAGAGDPGPRARGAPTGEAPTRPPGGPGPVGPPPPRAKRPRRRSARPPWPRVRRGAPPRSDPGYGPAPRSTAGRTPRRRRGAGYAAAPRQPQRSAGPGPPGPAGLSAPPRCGAGRPASVRREPWPPPGRPAKGSLGPRLLPAWSLGPALRRGR